MRPRYKKISNDLRTDLQKNVMLIIAIAIGVFSFGTILGGYAVLKREMAVNYLGTHPASATIELENRWVDSTVIDSISAMPKVKTAVRHATVSARMNIRDKWYPLLLFVIDDFKNMGTNIVTPVAGAKIPPLGSMLVERTALPVMQAAIGAKVLIKLPHSAPTEMTVAGTVHDPGLAPARQQQTGYGYLALQSLQQAGGADGFNAVRIIFDNPQISMQEAVSQSKQVASFLEESGYSIHEIRIPPPRRHPHQGQMNAILSLFSVFSFMILVLSSILTATSVSTLMVKQIREIGVMKTLGAGSRQISGLYLLMILLLSTVAVAFAVPLSSIAARLFYKKIALLLNLEITNPSIPAWVTLLQIASGQFIPLLAAFFPIVYGSRITVRQALDNYGVSGRAFGKGVIEKLLVRVRFLGDSLTLSIRNVFRKRFRLIMTLTLLSTGGALFMTALNVSKAWDANLLKIYKYRHYDLEIRLNDSITTEDILKKIKTISGIKTAEAWGYSTSAFARDIPYKINHTYPDKGHGSFIMLALWPDSPLISLPLQEGHWLNKDDAFAVVLNQVARAKLPNAKVGDFISLSLNHRSRKWRIAGFVEDVGSPATAFVPLRTFERVTDQKGTANMLRIAFDDRSPNAVLAKIMEIEQLLSREQISVDQSIPITRLRNAMAEHIGVLVNLLLAMSIMMGLVGGLGLMATMSMNVIERTREIGVLKAIGATLKKIYLLLIGEGLLAAMLSIPFALILGLLLSYYLGQLVGDMAFRTPLPLSLSYGALVIWFFIIIFGSIAATVYPAYQAIRSTTHYDLSYE